MDLLSKLAWSSAGLEDIDTIHQPWARHSESVSEAQAESAVPVAYESQMSVR